MDETMNICKNYKDCMMNFSQTDLRNILGEEIINLLAEWQTSDEGDLTKKRMVEMIDSIYGLSIFKDRNFRKKMLESMDKSAILKIRDDCLSGKEKQEQDLAIIINSIVNKTWGKNKTTAYLANVWGLNIEAVTKEKYNEDIKIELNASDEQFYELLDYQFLIKQRVLANLTSGNIMERMLVHMPTGTGKTKTAMHIITNYYNFTLKKSGLILWIAHTTELLQQAYDTFTNVWQHIGSDEINVYKIYGDSNINSSFELINGIAFCGLQKMLSIKKNNPTLFDNIKKECRLIVFDEAHKASAEGTSDLIEELMRMPRGYKNRSLVGLTATPGRTTEDTYDNKILSNMFGGKLINIDSSILNQINFGKLKSLNTTAEKNIIKYFQDREILARMIPQKLEYKIDFTQRDLKILSGRLRSLGVNDREYTNEQLEVFAKNKERNLAILRKIRALQYDKKPTIVFACSVEHAKMLSAMLTLENIKNSLVLGEMNSADRKKAINQFKDRNSGVDVIINYEVLTTGFDSKNIQCVFITRPTKSIILYSQMLGRGLRGPLMGGNKECILVDIADNLEVFDNETAFTHFNDYWGV